ncbi:hypothetical protein [Dactylosporangium sp. CA-233914]|uniref:hypothetical protein n=1 Tax=Dactylosporangium sp. CA-233914 TaxID=3239934 RepID=UPI003D94C595
MDRIVEWADNVLDVLQFVCKLICDALLAAAIVEIGIICFFNPIDTLVCIAVPCVARPLHLSHQEPAGGLAELGRVFHRRRAAVRWDRVPEPGLEGVPEAAVRGA